MSRFRRAFPGVVVRMQETSRDEIEQQIVNGTLDIAVILVSNLRNETQIDSEILIRSPRRLWLGADHPLMKKDAVSLAEIAREPYVMLTVDEADQTALRYWEPTPYRPKVMFATSSVEAVRSMVALNMGVTILSNMVYRPWSLEGQHVEVRPVTDPCRPWISASPGGGTRRCRRRCACSTNTWTGRSGAPATDSSTPTFPPATQTHETVEGADRV